MHVRVWVNVSERETFTEYKSMTVGVCEIASSILFKAMSYCPLLS